MEMDIGRRTFAAAATALGAIGLAWGAFAFFWQPIPPDLPGYRPLAYLAGGLLLAGGVAAQFQRWAGPGGLVLAAVFAAFSIPWAIRIVRFPQLFGTWGGFAEAFAPVLAGLIIASQGRDRLEDRELPAAERLCVAAFGICAIAFGLNHFLALPQTARMVPAWIPPGQMFWAVATGFFHAAAGVAILSRVQALLAARLLAAMIALFEILIWLPNLAREPAAHMTWAGNGVNLALAGAALVVADALSRVKGSSATSVPGRA